MSCENCNKCFEASAPECPSVLILNCQLTAATDYFIMVTDKFGEEYIQAVTSDANGKVVFKTNYLPAGSLNRHSGSWKIEVREDNTDCSVRKLKFCCDGTETEFDCVVLDFFQSSLGSLPTEVGCFCENNPELIGNVTVDENGQTIFENPFLPIETDLFEVFLNGILSDQFTWAVASDTLTYIGTTPLVTTDIIKVVKN